MNDFKYISQLIISSILMFTASLALSATDDQINEPNANIKHEKTAALKAPFIESDEIINLDELLDRTRNLKDREKQALQDREDAFMANREQQKTLVNNAKQAFLQEQKIANPLVSITDQQQKTIDLLQAKLNKHSEELGDIHSIYNQFSGDFVARMKDSLVQAQFPARNSALTNIQTEDALASIQDMRETWLLLMQEMTEAGKNTSFSADVINSQGKSKKQNVMRLGTFSLFSEGQFLRYIPQNQELLVIDQQPVEQSTMEDFYESVQNKEPTIQSAIIDPSRGDLLAILGQSPSLYERLLQGKEGMNAYYKVKKWVYLSYFLGWLDSY